MTLEQRDLIQLAIDYAVCPGETPSDEKRLAIIEATLRDALGQKHGVWRWRVGRSESQSRERGPWSENPMLCKMLKDQDELNRRRSHALRHEFARATSPAGASK